MLYAKLDWHSDPNFFNIRDEMFNLSFDVHVFVERLVRDLGLELRSLDKKTH